MRILIIATGSRGDVQPYIALGKGLQAAGHQVRFMTHENFEALVTSHGLDFWGIGGDVQEIAQSADMRQRVEGGNFLRLMAQMAREAQQGAVRLAQTGLAAVQEMDHILAGMGGLYIGLAIAEKLKLPLIQAYLLPFTPTREFPSVLVPNIPTLLGGSINRLSHHLTRQVIWQGFRSADNSARREILAMSPASFFGPYTSDRLRGMPVLYGFSPSVIARPGDWNETIHITGYWTLDSSSDWQPPADLMDFLTAGQPPVYIGFGSMSSRDPRETASLVIKALEMCGQRAVLSSGWGGLDASDLPDSICMLESVPHSWLFPQLAAVVHHGGAGTTGAGLRAGIPSIIVPFFGDQPFWGKRVAELGVGPAPIPRKQLTAARLAAAIQEAVSSEDMHQRAAQLGKKIQSEDGISNAVEIIQQG